jgi:hypothetical protein
MCNSEEQNHFERTLLAFYSKTWTYHNEKEKMVYNFIVLEGALLAASISAMSLLTLHLPQYVFFFFVIPLCILLHMMVRWQLRAKREAAIYTAAIQSLLFKFVTQPPALEEMVSKEVFNTRTEHAALINTLFDFIFPLPSGANSGSEGGLPKCLQAAIREQPTRVYQSEWMATISSVFLLSALSGCWLISLWHLR